MNKKDVLHEFGFRINNGSVIGGNNWPIDRLNAMADEIIKLRQQTSVLRGLLIELTDEDDCRYDHHGYCQAHSLDTAPCPHSRSKTLIKEMYL